MITKFKMEVDLTKATPKEIMDAIDNIQLNIALHLQQAIKTDAAEIECRAKLTNEGSDVSITITQISPSAIDEAMNSINGLNSKPVIDILSTGHCNCLNGVCAIGTNNKYCTKVEIHKAGYNTKQINTYVQS